MKRNFRISIFIILTVLLSRGIVYSQELSWEPTSKRLNNTSSISVASNGYLWVVAGNGVYLSTDNGDTWVTKNNGLSDRVISIAINPVNDYLFVNSKSKGLFRSTNRGENWVKVTNDVSISRILITASGKIYCTSGKVYYSDDNGDTWIEKSNGLPNENITSLALGADGTLYAGTANSWIYCSTDGGDTWLQPLYNTIYDLTSSDDGSIFVVNNKSKELKGLFRSIDRGETWVKVTVDMDVHDILITASEEIYYEIYYKESKKVYYSNDNGDTWIEKSNELLDPLPIKSLALAVNGTLYVETYYSEWVSYSTDGGDTWSRLKYKTIYDLTISDDGSIFASIDEGFIKSTDRGATWVNTGIEDRTGTIIYNPITKDIFISDNNDNIYISTNLGASWELINEGIPDDDIICAFAFNPNTGRMYVATDEGVYHSINYPNFWELTTLNENISSIAVASNGDIWAITGDYKTLNNVYLSIDNGDTWATKNNGLPDHVNSIAINPVNGYIFVDSRGSEVKSKGLFRSTNRGESWVKVTNNMDITEILITESGKIYLGSRGKVYYSSDNGNTWTQRSIGLPDRYVGPLALGTDGTLYVEALSAEASRVVYRSTNGGDTWLSLPLNYNFKFIDITFSDDGSIFASRMNGNVLKSTDRGVTWTEVYTGEYSIWNIIYNPITKDIFATGFLSSYVYRSINLGASWELKNSGLQLSSLFDHVEQLAFNSITGQMYVATTGGVYRSRNYPEQVRNKK